MNSDGSLNVVDTLRLNGALTVSNGNFTATSVTSGNLDNARIAASGSSSVVLPPAGITSYSMTLRDTNDYTLFSANGSGTVLNLSSLKSLLADGRNGNYETFTISATNSGSINLSGVETITAPTFTDPWSADYLQITTSNGGQIDLSHLKTIGSLGTGYVSFTSDAATMSYPALEAAAYARFYPANGATLSLPALTTLANSQIGTTSSMDLHVQFGDGLTGITGCAFSGATGNQFAAANVTGINGSSFTGGTGTQFNFPNATALSNNAVTLNGASLTTGVLTGIDNCRFALEWGEHVRDARRHRVVFHDASRRQFLHPIFGRRLGDGTQPSSLKSLLADGRNGNYETFTISATNSGSINLSGVETITAPTFTDPWSADYLQITTSNGGQMDLSHLKAIGSVGTGYVNITATDGTLHVGSLNCTAKTIVSLTGVGTELTSDGNILLGPASTLSVGTGLNMRVGGRFEYQTSTETAMAVSGAILQFNGHGVQQLELGGVDAGNADPGNNGNFGFGQLVVGQDTRPTVLELRDAINNGNRGGGGATPEALYLFGQGGPDGLVLRGGSTLLVRNLNVYAKQAGTWTSLQGLFPSGQDIIAYSGGFLSRSAAAMPGGWNVDANGAWWQEANWLLMIPNGLATSAAFGNKITAPRIVTVDVPVILGSMLFDSGQPYTISGTMPITMAAGDSHATIEARRHGRRDHRQPRQPDERPRCDEQRHGHALADRLHRQSLRQDADHARQRGDRRPVRERRGVRASGERRKGRSLFRHRPEHGHRSWHRADEPRRRGLARADDPPARGP